MSSQSLERGKVGGRVPWIHVVKSIEERGQRSGEEEGDEKQQQGEGALLLPLPLPLPRAYFDVMQSSLPLSLSLPLFPFSFALSSFILCTPPIYYYYRTVSRRLLFPPIRLSVSELSIDIRAHTHTHWLMSVGRFG